MEEKKGRGRPTKQQVMEQNKAFIEKDIIDYSKEQNKRVFSEKEMTIILHNYQADRTLLVTTTLGEFLNFLMKDNFLKVELVSAPFAYRPLKKYTLGDVSDFEIALSIRPTSFLSHYSAMFLHDLTDNIPNTIYTNMEQTPKPKNSGRLQQENIDKAFSRPMRKTNNIGKYNNNKIFLLNGKNTGRAGVTKHELLEFPVAITNTERTLIDAVVRPDYAGGVQEVLNAFIAAKERLSVNKMVATLKKMDYTYPYHQAIGFYLERAGYSDNVLNLLEELEIKHNFYLTYGLKDKEFIDRWKLFVPKRF